MSKLLDLEILKLYEVWIGIGLMNVFTYSKHVLKMHQHGMINYKFNSIQVEPLFREGVYFRTYIAMKVECHGI